MMSINRQIRLKIATGRHADSENFETAEAPMPAAADGEVLRRTIYLSLDPYMRGRMSDAPSYAASVELGDVMCGHTVSEVVESRNPGFQAGDIVAGYDGWQEYAVVERQGSAQARSEGGCRSRPRSACSACRA